MEEQEGITTLIQLGLWADSTLSSCFSLVSEKSRQQALQLASDRAIRISYSFFCMEYAAVCRLRRAMNSFWVTLLSAGLLSSMTSATGTRMLSKQKTQLMKDLVEQVDIRSFTAILGTNRGSDRLEKRASCLLNVIQRTSEERVSRRRKTATYAYPGSSNDKLFEANYRHKHHISPKCACSNSHQDKGLVCEASRKLSCDQLGCDHARLVPRIRLKEKQQLEKNGNIKDAQAPSVFIGQVGSADTVLKSGIDRDRLAREHDILAFESEGSGIWEEFPCVIVKGVCDYADSHNSKLRRQNPFILS